MSTATQAAATPHQAHAAVQHKTTYTKCIKYLPVLPLPMHALPAASKSMQTLLNSTRTYTTTHACQRRVRQVGTQTRATTRTDISPSFNNKTCTHHGDDANTQAATAYSSLHAQCTMRTTHCSGCRASLHNLKTHLHKATLPQLLTQQQLP
jgi:hypothetical protein